MKSIICTFAIATLALIGAAPQAEARSYYQSGSAHFSGYSSSGKPIYTKRYLAGYDHCGRPIWVYRSAPAPTRCHVAPVYRPRPCYDSRPRFSSGVVVYGSFRR